MKKGDYDMFQLIKSMYLKSCTQPGSRGLDARKRLERGMNWFGWIPLFGWMLRKMVPTDAEIDAELKRLGRRQYL